ncbi:MAG: Mrp/NBP35 family ATP-binding protein [candidate division Zixibacteria bacterium]|nr:Mrp/NBP35 family ATP-binding protein [candidate division Zixibacteria bacterium]
MPTEDQVLQALRQVIDPDLHRDIVTLGFVKDVAICEGAVKITLELTTPACPVKDRLKEEAEQAIRSIPGVDQVNVKMDAQVRPTLAQMGSMMIPGVRNVVPIGSGKGGVGKSTVSANIAVALAQTGARVGLMDADVYGPSIPTIMGITDAPKPGEKGIIPIEAYGVKVISMGFFLKPDQAVVWRGPMLTKMIDQFLGGVEWGEIDYLIVDLPPGTGDIHLSLCQRIPLSGAAIVSTPQDVALQVAQKAVIMFNQLKTPILGLIENMSYFVCPHCGQRENIFDTGGARRAAGRMNLPFLGEIPLATRLRETSDSGRPIVVSDPKSPAAVAFQQIARALAAQVSIRNAEETAAEPVKITF